LVLNKYFSESLYENLSKTLEDRNKLSHVYKEEMYNEVYKNLDAHLTIFQNLLMILNK
jgi:uncharacterized protein YutE (UPF0331/DUF86 family)